MVAVECAAIKEQLKEKPKSTGVDQGAGFIIASNLASVEFNVNGLPVDVPTMLSLKHDPVSI